MKKSKESIEKLVTDLKDTQSYARAFLASQTVGVAVLAGIRAGIIDKSLVIAALEAFDLTEQDRPRITPADIQDALAVVRDNADLESEA